MRIVYFQNWSLLGGVLGEWLLNQRLDEVLLVGPDVPRLYRDAQLIAAAKRHRVPILTPKELLEPQFVRRVREFEPDLLVVVTFAKKIPNELLAVPRLAAINMHPAYLPSYRGACPEFWVIRNGETQTGLTLHRMTERFDAGEILSQVRVPILPDDTMLSLTERMVPAGMELLRDLLARYRAGDAPQGQAQDATLVSRAPNVRPEHLQVCWTEPAASIDRLVRAAHPAYEVYTAFRDGYVLLQKVRPMPGLQSSVAPGELLVLSGQRRVLAGTADGLLELTQVGIPGGASFSGWAFQDEYGLSSGERLGDPSVPAVEKAPGA